MLVRIKSQQQEHYCRGCNCGCSSIAIGIGGGRRRRSEEEKEVATEEENEVATNSDMGDVWGCTEEGGRTWVDYSIAEQDGSGGEGGEERCGGY